jgi:hypothetical protein
MEQKKATEEHEESDHSHRENEVSPSTVLLGQAAWLYTIRHRARQQVCTAREWWNECPSNYTMSIAL